MLSLSASKAVHADRASEAFRLPGQDLAGGDGQPNVP